MERYYNDDKDDRDDEPYFGSDEDYDEDDEMDGEAVAYIDQQSIIDVMQMDLAQTELNQHLLSKAIEIAQKSWFWCFKSAEAKMDEIEVIYKKLQKITNEEEKEDEDADV